MSRAGFRAKAQEHHARKVAQTLTCVLRILFALSTLRTIISYTGIDSRTSRSSFDGKKLYDIWGMSSKVVFGVLFGVYTVMKCNWSPATERAPADKRPFLIKLVFICFCLCPAVPLKAQNAQLSGLIRDPANLAV